MKLFRKLIKPIAIYLLPTIAIITFFEVGLRKVLNTYNKRKIVFEKNIADYQILVLGSSHAFRGINPALFRHKGFNLANASQTLYYDLEIVKKYIDRMPALKMVLINVDFLSFEFDLDKSQEYWRCFFYEKHLNIPLESNNHRFDIKRFSLADMYGRKRSLGFFLKGFNVDLAKSVADDGFMAKDITHNDRNLISTFSGKKRADYHRQFCLGITDPSENIAYLEELIKLLKDHDVTPVIMTIPTFITYYQNFSEGERAFITNTAKAIGKKYSVNYFDYLKDPRFIISDFYDNDHLCHHGANKFSRIINQEILIPLFRKE
ncbi:MAG: hypothetical protein GY858_02000 [Candidatus Omnitrophica bacterium]|nr:hypothetical protein [Candidatus Omnitrophota bacterium]